jgi:hypothetical protein
VHRTALARKMFAVDIGVLGAAMAAVVPVTYMARSHCAFASVIRFAQRYSVIIANATTSRMAGSVSTSGGGSPASDWDIRELGPGDVGWVEGESAWGMGWVNVELGLAGISD